MRAGFSSIRLLPTAKFVTPPLAAGLLALSAMCVPAIADNLTINDVEFANGYQDINITGPISDSGQETGELQFSGTDTTTHTSFSEPLWCDDIYHDVDLGSGQNLSYTTSVGLWTNPNNGALSDTQINEMSWLIIAGTEYMTGAGHGNSVDSAALQTAIWALEYPGFAYNTGVNGLSALTSFYMAEAVTYGASGAGCGSHSYCTWDSDVVSVNGGTLQSQAGYWNGQGYVPRVVPEPGSLALLGTALLGFGGWSWRRKTKAKTGATA